MALRCVHELEELYYLTFYRLAGAYLGGGGLRPGPLWGEKICTNI